MEVEKLSAVSDQLEAGSQQQRVRSKEQEAGNQKQEAGSGHPVSSVQHRASGIQHLASSIELLLAAVAGGLWHLEGGSIWYAGRGPGPWPLTLLGLLWASRLIRSLGTAAGRRRLRPSVFTVPLALFFASVGVSFWAAYDPAIALAKVWLIVGALGAYWALAGQPDLPQIYNALAFAAIFCITLTFYFLMTHDWTAYAPKVPALTALGSAITTRLPRLDAHSIDPNVVGGLLAVSLPLTVPLAALLGRDEIPGVTRGSRYALGILGVLGLLAGTFGVIIAVSRGAWTALLVTASLWLLWEFLIRRQAPRPRVVMTGVILAGCAITVGLITTIASGALAAALNPTAGSLPDRLLSAAQGALTDRLRIFQLAALLVRATPFTGIGPGMFEMHFSIYALLIHVGYLLHSHNLLLDLAIEQGLLGPAAYLALVATALTWKPSARNRELDAGYSMPDTGSQKPAAHPQRITDNWKLTTVDRHLRAAAIASISVTLIHGLVDDTLYGSRGLLLLFVPFGLLVAVGRLPGYDTNPSVSPVHTAGGPDTADDPRRKAVDAGPAAHASSPLAHRVAGLRRRPQLVALVVVTLIGGGALTLWKTPIRTLRAAWFANLGAIAEARVELNVYDAEHFGDPTMSGVRREQDLSEAIAHFERALAVDPVNTTAHQRLAMIAQARGDYPAALAHMQALWDAGRRDRVTRLLYGDALVDTGRVDEAVAIVQGLEFAQDRLSFQAWAREQESADPKRAAYAREAAALLGR